jgi:vancomycin resistance protein YoaR
MQGLLVQPGEIFSFWGLTDPPDEKHGFKDGATFINHRVSSAVGGGLCQLSGLLHNLALLAGCPILERHSHSIDAYGEGRYIPLGRDATVTYPRADLCFANPHPFPLLLKIHIARDRAEAWFFTPQPLPYLVEIEVSEPILHPSPPQTAEGFKPGSEMEVLEKGLEGKEVDSWRLFRYPSGRIEKEFLFHSSYQSTPTTVRRRKIA